MSGTIEEIVKKNINSVFLLYKDSFSSEQSQLLATIQSQLAGVLINSISLNSVGEKLNILFQHEKNYLELIKTYKEEIKFSCSIQEDLRKERAKFFSSVLDEVSSTLKSAQVDEVVASKWIAELVSTYTKSLDASSCLVNDTSIDSLDRIKKMSQKEVKSLD